MRNGRPEPVSCLRVAADVPAQAYARVTPEPNSGAPTTHAADIDPVLLPSGADSGLLVVTPKPSARRKVAERDNRAALNPQ